MDDLQENRSYWTLKEETLDRTLLRTVLLEAMNLSQDKIRFE
jgi:hypothetical protein